MGNQDLEFVCVGFYDIYVYKDNYDDIKNDPSSYIDIERIRKEKEFWIYFGDDLINQDDGIEKAEKMIDFFLGYLKTKEYGIKVRSLI